MGCYKRYQLENHLIGAQSVIMTQFIDLIRHFFKEPHIRRLRQSISRIAVVRKSESQAFDHLFAHVSLHLILMVFKQVRQLLTSIS